MEKTWRCDKCYKKILNRDVYCTEKIEAEDGYNFYQTVAYCSKRCYDDSIYIKCRRCGDTFHRDNGYQMAGCRVEYCSRSCERLADP